MTSLDLRFHHMGLAARRPEPARRFLEAVGYEVAPAVLDPRQGVMLAMAAHASMPRVEVVTPVEGTDGPLGAVLRAQTELVYHVCYEVPAVDLAVERLRATVGAVRMVSPPTPAVLFGGRPVSFWMVAGVGLVELLEVGP